jgi:hypothetical protein
VQAWQQAIQINASAAQKIEAQRGGAEYSNALRVRALNYAPPRRQMLPPQPR